MSSVIETGVDKLVRLIEKEKKLTLNDASKRLGVAETVVQEWADFLEEEGVINVDYKLTKTYLVERQINKKELEAKAKEISGKKDVFVRKIEGAVKSLENDSSGLDHIKKEFSDLQEKVASEIDRIKDKLVQLERYENLKKNIDKQIRNQHQEILDKTAKIEREISGAKKTYQEILHDIQTESLKLQEEKQRAELIRQEENKLLEKLDQMEAVINKIRGQAKDEDKAISESEGRINKMRATADAIRNDITKKRDSLGALYDESKEQERKILALQNEVLDEIKTKGANVKDDMVSTEAVTKQFENFFKKKNEIDALVDKAMIDRDKLKRELQSLAKSALAFTLSQKSGTVKGQIGELEKKFDDYDKRQGLFKKEIEQIKKLISK